MHSHVTLDSSVKLLLDSITILVTEATASNDLSPQGVIAFFVPWHPIIKNVDEHLVVEMASLEALCQFLTTSTYFSSSCICQSLCSNHLQLKRFSASLTDCFHYSVSAGRVSPALLSARAYLYLSNLMEGCMLSFPCTVISINMHPQWHSFLIPVTYLLNFLKFFLFLYSLV